jgi:excisionase family DNA binding protein
MANTDVQVDRLLHSMTEGAETVGLSRAGFLKLVYSEVIPTVMIGGRRLVSRKALEAYVDGLEAGEVNAE